MAGNLKRLYRLLLIVITLSTGLIVLLSFLVKSDTLLLLRSVFVEWTIIVIAFALLLGILNVLRVHGQRIQRGQGLAFSLILIVAFLAVFVPGILSPASVPSRFSALAGPTGSIVSFAYQYVQRPLQATFFSLMAFFVLTAAWRAFRVRSVASFIMLVAAVIVLLGSIKLNIGIGWGPFTEARDWVMNVPAMAGARGILLGIVLGTIVAGLRLLLGIDRPYSD